MEIIEVIVTNIIYDSNTKIMSNYDISNGSLLILLTNINQCMRLLIEDMLMLKLEIQVLNHIPVYPCLKNFNWALIFCNPFPP